MRKPLRLAVRIAGVALVSLGAGCKGAVLPPGPWHEESGYRWRELHPPPRGGPGFVDLPASRTGIHFVIAATLHSPMRNRHLASGGGLALSELVRAVAP